MGIAQDLYEKHKVTTYPRTDSSALPEDYAREVARILTEISNQYPLAGEILQNSWISESNKRVFNDAEISEHFAIIPNGNHAAGLTVDEQKIYGTNEEQNNNKGLCPLVAGETAQNVGMELHEGQTKPPARFTEAR